MIRHVQTTEEAHFAHMADALSFIARYVDITQGGSESGETESEIVSLAKHRPMDSIR